jgi:hypothetical protein
MTWQLDWSHATADVPEDGLRVERSATAQELAALTAALEVLAFARLDVRYAIEPLPGGRYRMSGEVAAALEQSCVVTLEPVPAEIVESFDVEFWPAGTLAASRPATSDHSAFAPDDPEPIENHRLAVGRVIYETLAAAIDPYPRASGVEFEGAESPKGSGAANPFAVLEKWKARRE